MREILFKAKRLSDGKWVEGNLFLSDDKKCQICIGTPIIRICYDVDPATVCQYTGLKDKNGEMIFEGDIVKLRTGRVCKIEYRSNNCVLGFDLTAIRGFDKPGVQYSIYGGMEIMGNIHDKEE